ncbi:glycosyltransferase [Pseudomonas costantinii]|uniref:Glycosyl transferase family 1 n=1 Tax=Pseudomonas costantinii TaxID=168469 RepID=A0A1S2V478_9PSED|nr:glycosyltransferase [Pseudomonas costantinii]NVZ21662.1 glycosyl transferase family 1 [Pseudomonas costantinii]OIN53522.1 glycosyl transferase family 1 [Pseudomonas costantinii]SEE35985.1 Glycosyltransferase involved in cell wall bisynthesis [Pseudomonas costantinii]
MSQNSVRLHLTNIAGMGAVQLLKSLLPALEQSKRVRIVEAYLPDSGDLSTYQSEDKSIKMSRYRRHLPNALSRLVECLFLGGRFSGELPLLVMGDLPIRCKTRQTVFVQTPHLLRPARFSWRIAGLKSALLRWVFRSNIQYAHAFIVQTTLMRDALIESYPSLQSRVHVVPQPVPAWLLNSGLQRTARAETASEFLHLIYPAAGYPHKNHKLLAAIDDGDVTQWPIASLDITLDENSNPAPDIPWLRCQGVFSSQQMLDAYNRVDALLFLSTHESYGFPLVEAMFTGLPIICPDLPYARVLCGEGAIYFHVDNADSLKNAVNELHRRLSAGYWPDWSEQLKAIPRDWETVATNMLDIAAQPIAGATNKLNARED